MPSNGIPVPPPLILPQNGTGSLPPLPIGVDLPPGLTCPDAISRTLTTLPPAQLLDVLSQMKSLVTTDAAKAAELLRQAPQLSYAIFQALLLMGLVSAESLTSVVEPSVPPPPATVPPPPAVQATTSLQNTQYPIPIPGQAFPGYPPPPPHLTGQIGTPPVHTMTAYPPPPPPQYQPPRAQQPAPQAQPQPDTDALVQQVLAMPQSLIDQLPPAERAQLLALRATFLQQGH
jgi:cleavage stimulation factor subunit 2